MERNVEDKAWALAMAALNHDPDSYGPMDEKEKKRYESLVEEFDEAKKLNPNIVISIPTSYPEW